MTAGETQANPYIVTCIMCVFGTLARVLFDFWSSRSFVSYSFALHVDQEFAPLRNKLVVMRPLREQILHNTILKGCEILVDGVVFKANLIPLEMYDFDVILGMDWLSTHYASVDCFCHASTRKSTRGNRREPSNGIPISRNPIENSQGISISRPV